MSKLGDISFGMFGKNGKPTKPVYRMLDIRKLDPDETNYRRSINDDSMEDLADSVKSVGVKTPLVVLVSKDRYKIINGHRRYQAAVNAGLDELPCVIFPSMNDEELKINQFLDNEMREDLWPFDRAEALSDLRTRLEESEGRKISQKELAGMVGLSRSRVSELISILRIPESNREKCRTSDISKLILIAKEKDPKKQDEILKADSVREAKQKVSDVRHFEKGDLSEAQARGYSGRDEMPEPPKWDIDASPKELEKFGLIDELSPDEIHKALVEISMHVGTNGEKAFDFLSVGGLRALGKVIKDWKSSHGF